MRHYDSTYTGTRIRYALLASRFAPKQVPADYIVDSQRPHEDYVFGTIDFPRELTAEEVCRYQLLKLTRPAEEVDSVKPSPFPLLRARQIACEMLEISKRLPNGALKSRIKTLFDLTPPGQGQFTLRDDIEAAAAEVFEID